MKFNNAQKEFEYFITKKENNPLSFNYAGSNCRGLKDFIEINKSETLCNIENSRQIIIVYLHKDKKLQLSINFTFYKLYIL